MRIHGERSADSAHLPAAGGQPASDGGRTSSDVALAQSVLYEALALGLSRPDELALSRLAGSGGRQVLRAAAALVDTSAQGGTRVAPAVARLEALRWTSLSRLQERYDELVGHTIRGRVCPFETEYGGLGVLQQPHELADIGGYYAAFGLRPLNRAGLRVDHIACECEFLAFLCRKEAVALEAAAAVAATAADRETLGETRRAARQFLRAHLGRFGVALGSRFAAEDPEGFHGRMGELLGRYLEAECERLNVPPGPVTLGLRPADLDDVPMACGSGEDLIQIQGLTPRADP